jgi:hypothetical protein
VIKLEFDYDSKNICYFDVEDYYLDDGSSMFLGNVGTIYEAVRCHKPEHRNMKYYQILFLLKMF